MTLFFSGIGDDRIGRQRHDAAPLRLEVQTGEPKRMASGDGTRRSPHRPDGQRADRRPLLPAQRTLPAVDRQGRLDLRSPSTPEPLTRGYEHVRLEFLGLDTYADVFLNETQILTADNMFRRWAAEVKPLLKERGNVLRVHFHPPINKALPQYESPALSLRGLERSGGQRGTRRKKTQPLHPQGGLSLRLGLGSAAGYVGHLASGKNFRAGTSCVWKTYSTARRRSRPKPPVSRRRWRSKRQRPSKRRRHRLRRQTGARSRSAAPRGMNRVSVPFTIEHRNYGGAAAWAN